VRISKIKGNGKEIESEKQIYRDSTLNNRKKGYSTSFGE